MNSMIKTAFRLCLYGLILCILLGVIGVVAIAGLVFFGDESSLKKSTILAKINRESVILCNDGKRKMGSFFNSAHLDYVTIDQTPKHLKSATVAAEDKKFYSHYGFDPFAIANAVAEGVRNGGKFRRGGSTITQQTVKNIMGAWERKFARKFNELISAIKLEQMYSKDEILEFYLNQFHVAGNGQGVGIAARYYFNKNVEDLSLVESAFIAGSVKGPSRYNPFIKYTEEDRQKSRARAKERKNYVIGRMLVQGMITQKEHDEAVKKEVPFNQGKFRSRQVTMVDVVRKHLNKEEILETLGLESIEELASAGMAIHTTIDCDLQESAQHKMRKNLSRLETILKGFSKENVDAYKKKRSIEVGEFYYARVKEVQKHKVLEKTKLKMDMGYPQGEISGASLKRYAMRLDLSEGKTWRRQLKNVVSKLKKDDILYVEVIAYDKEKNQATLELRKRPKINGGMMALDRGRVRAVVSGFDTTGYNRAIQAKRSPGSVYKVLTYLGALQLGWNILDRIDNRRRLFNYQGQFYYPRPDHRSPYLDVSMIWAGIYSENLASVNLGAQLLDKMNYAEFRKLLEFMELAPKKGEATKAYSKRLTKSVGASASWQGVKEHFLAEALQELSTDMVFSGNARVFEILEKMWWGAGYAREMRRIALNKDDELKEPEIAFRLDMLKNNFIRFGKQSKQLQKDWELLQRMSAQSGEEISYNSGLKVILDRFRVLGGASRPRLAYFYAPSNESSINMDKYTAHMRKKPGRPLNPMDVKAIWSPSFLSNKVSTSSTLLEGMLTVSDFYKLRSRVQSKTAGVRENPGEKGLRQAFLTKDFRIGLSLKYLTLLSKALGVESKVDPVLSLPLGANVISTAEVAKMYQAFVDGKVYRFYKDGPANQITFIDRIEDREGAVVYRPEEKVTQFTKPEYADQLREILRRIVTHGTGNRARSELFVKSGKSKVRVPAYGKTGTTNDYTTSYFAGFIPYPSKKASPMRHEDSHVIAAYVGYDLNETMKKGRIRVYGGTGALPLWIDFGKDIIEKHDYKKYLSANITKKGEWSMKFPGRTRMVQVDLPRGAVTSSRGVRSDGRDFGLTDMNTEGEVFRNEFALTAGVNAPLQLPLKGREVMRKVGFFSKETRDSIKQYYDYKQRKREERRKISKKQETKAP